MSTDMVSAEIRNKASYVDPNGYLYEKDGKLHRHIFPHAESYVKSLLEKETVQNLMSARKLVPTSIESSMQAEGTILTHERISPLSYCTEWCPSMLKDAALSVLDLELQLIPQGLSLQDAYPWNIVFEGTRAVHVDFTSIVPAPKGLIWTPYQQFLNFFLFPLELSASGRGKIVRQLFTDCISGISLDDFLALAPLAWKLRHPLRTLGFYVARRIEKIVSANIERQIKFSALVKKQQSKANISKESRVAFIRKLRSQIESIKIQSPKTNWSEYYKEVHSQQWSNAKTEGIAKIVASYKPKSVLDIGCNAGVYSLIAANQGCLTISIDGDEVCIENLYAIAKRDKLKITPLVVNLNAPTPGYGFLKDQFPALVDRLSADATFFLGIMHHIHISGRQSFERMGEFLSAITDKYCVFEYIDTLDDNIARIEHAREISYNEDSVVKSFAPYFKVEAVFPSDRSTRKLIVFKKLG